MRIEPQKKQKYTHTHTAFVEQIANKKLPAKQRIKIGFIYTAQCSTLNHNDTMWIKQCCVVVSSSKEQSEASLLNGTHIYLSGMQCTS